MAELRPEQNGQAGTEINAGLAAGLGNAATPEIRAADAISQAADLNPSQGVKDVDQLVDQAVTQQTVDGMPATSDQGGAETPPSSSAQTTEQMQAEQLAHWQQEQDKRREANLRMTQGPTRQAGEQSTDAATQPSEEKLETEEERKARIDQELQQLRDSQQRAKSLDEQVQDGDITREAAAQIRAQQAEAARGTDTDIPLAEGTMVSEPKAVEPLDQDTMRNLQKNGVLEGGPAGRKNQDSSPTDTPDDGVADKLRAAGENGPIMKDHTEDLGPGDTKTVSAEPAEPEPSSPRRTDEEYTSVLTEAAKAAEADRNAAKKEGRYVDPADPEDIAGQLKRREISLAEAAKKEKEQKEKAQTKVISEDEKKAQDEELLQKFGNKEPLTPEQLARVGELQAEKAAEDAAPDPEQVINDLQKIPVNEWSEEQKQQYTEASQRLEQKRWEQMTPEQQMDLYEKQVANLYLKATDVRSTPEERAKAAAEMQTIFDKVHGVNKSPSEREQAKQFAENMLNPNEKNQNRLTKKEQELQRDIQEKLHTLMMLEKRLESQNDRLKKLKEQRTKKRQELRSMRTSKLEAMTEEKRQEMYNKYLELNAVHAQIQVTRHESTLVDMQRRDTIQYVRRKLGVSHGLGAMLEYAAAKGANALDNADMWMDDKLGSFDEEAGLMSYVNPF